MEEAKLPQNGQTSKKNHPRQDAGVLSKMFYCWTIPTFIKGYKKDLDENDFNGPLKAHEANCLGNRLEEAWVKEENRGNPSLWKAIIKTFGLEILLYSLVPMSVDLLLKTTQPIFLRKLLSYFKPIQSVMTKGEAYMYASLIVLEHFCIILCVHFYMLGFQQLGMKIRVANSSLLYRKALKLSKSAVADTTLGQMVNLLANDVNRFDMAVNHVHQLFTAPIIVVVISYLLYVNLGYISLTGIVMFLIFIPVQMLVGRLSSRYRLRTAVKTDQRVRLMNEIITGIQVIKMYTWEKPFEKLVDLSRKLEIREIRAISYIRTINHGTLSLFVNRTAIFLTILTYVLTQNRLDAEFVFVTSAFYGVLKQTLTMSLYMGVTVFAETLVSVKRIQKFLQYEEIPLEENSNKLINGYENNQNKARSNSIPLSISQIEDQKIGVSIANGSAQWVTSSSDDTLHNITFSAGSKQLIGVVGPVGSGKTTLLHILLKELPLTKGTINVGGRISYASQEPWLFSGSIRQNILFGQTMDEEKYRKVIQVCSLERDFSLFPFSDRTIVGEKGVMLSGGQKARVNLARAIYKDADIYLLDDPLSAVDTQVGKQLFDNCIAGYLKEKCTILVTHQLQYLSVVDRIYLLENGTITASGTYNDLLSSDRDFLKLLESESPHEDDIDVDLKKIKSAKSLEKVGDQPAEVKEQKSKGTVSGLVYKRYFQSGGSLFVAFLFFLLFIVAQLADSGADYFSTFWVNLEQSRTEKEYDLKNNFSEVATNSTTSDENTSFTEIFFTADMCIYIYTAIVIFIVFITISRSIAFLQFCMRASRNLHNNMFAKIVQAPMRFFNTNPSGRILNRFAKDIGYIDERLPMTIADTIQKGLNVLAITLLIASVNTWILIPSAFIVVIFYFLRIFFLATSRDLKRLEGMTRSPVFSHLAASIQGLTTIRAFGAQNVLRNEFDKHQDLHSSIFYMYLACTRTFGFWLDMHCVVYIALVTFSFLFMGTETFAGNVGLAVTQSIALTGTFQFAMRQWSELETQMTAVERVLEYADVKPEADNRTKAPPKQWPEEGNIEFKSLSLRYALKEPFVLKNLCFKIKSKEKIGIVGRTGAGKSSLIAALFRLVETEGQILIDRIDTKEISLNDLRSKISIIPQEPVLFSGTLRRNLDPFEEYDDERLWSALEDVELKNFVAELPSGINTKVAEAGSNFSVGQRQLICLARAIIRNNKILVLDEATANVDPQTDELIQSSIRNKFRECTVLTIAHRLHTVMDSDKVLVMDAGEAVEFDHPHVLLQNSNGAFFGLVKQTGRSMADNLRKIALQNVQSHHKLD